MSGIILDAGALIALERDDRVVWAALKLVALQKAPAVVPSTVVAQVWRGGSRQAMLGRALAPCTIAGFDGLARAVGELCGKTKTTDICDAHVALVAAERGGVLWTSDPRDLRRLLAALRPRRPVVIARC